MTTTHAKTDFEMAIARAAVRGFPQRHLSRILDRLTTMDRGRTEAWETLRTLTREGGMVILTGPNGHGKTHMACLLAVKWQEAGLGSVKYWTAHDLMRDLYAAMNRAGEDRRKESPEDLARRVKLLVIDQLNELNTNSEHARSAIVAILNHRYNAGLPTVLVTNQSPDHLKTKVLGPDIHKINDGGGVIVCNWNYYSDSDGKE